MTIEIFYTALLHLYPKPFRARFGAEMLQLFRDCYPDAMPSAFWTETIKDFAVSIPREWRREIQREDSKIDYTALTDAVMVSSVVGPLLLWWGWIATVILLDLRPNAQSALLWNPAGIFLIVLATLAMACMVGVVSAMAAARTGRIDTTSWSKLANCEKSTARFSR
jgi:hypothetical protein